MLDHIQNQTSQGGLNRYIKACVKSNITKAVFKCPRRSSAHFNCIIRFMDICHGEHLLFLNESLNNRV